MTPARYASMFAGVVLGSSALFLGCDQDQELTVDKELQWEAVTLSAPWAGRIDSGYVRSNAQFWVVGGLHGSTDENGHATWSSLDDVWSSPDGESWARMASLPGPYEGQATVFGNKVFFVSEEIGENSGIPYAMLKVFSSENGTDWTDEQRLDSPPPRRRHVMLAFDDKLWILGGVSYFKTPEVPPTDYNDVWYSEDGNAWHQATGNAPWSPRNRLAGFVFRNRIWIVGGESFDRGNTAYHRDMWSSPDGVAWTKEKEFTYEWGDAGCSALGAVVHADTIWLVLGWGGGEVRAMYSKDGKTWSGANAEPPWSARGSFGLLESEERLWLIGGGSEGEDRREVWRSESLSAYGP